MKYEDKIKHLKQLLIENGQKKNSRGPFHHLILRKLGKEPVPPLFRRPVINFMDLGTAFGLSWGILMYFLVWKHDEMYTPSICISASIIAGILFGLFMAIYYRRTKEKLGLPDWNNFPDSTK